MSELCQKRRPKKRLTAENQADSPNLFHKRMSTSGRRDSAVPSLLSASGCRPLTRNQRAIGIARRIMAKATSGKSQSVVIRQRPQATPYHRPAVTKQAQPCPGTAHVDGVRRQSAQLVQEQQWATGRRRILPVPLNFYRPDAQNRCKHSVFNMARTSKTELAPFPCRDP